MSYGDIFTTIANVLIKDYLLFKVNPSTNNPKINNKIKLWGYWAAVNIKIATLIRIIFAAMDKNSQKE